MDYYSIDPTSFRYISHHGILGQKWGVRRYQNKDGTLTDAGKKRNYKELVKANRKGVEPKETGRVTKSISDSVSSSIKANKAIFDEFQDIRREYDRIEDRFRSDKSLVQKYILAAWDKGDSVFHEPDSPLRKYIKETKLDKPFYQSYYIGDKRHTDAITTDVTPSLLKLWNNKVAQDAAFSWYQAYDPRDEYKNLDKRWHANYEKYKKYEKELVDSVLGQYGDKKIKTVDRYVKRGAFKGYRDTRYDKASSLVISEMLKQRYELYKDQ